MNNPPIRVYTINSANSTEHYILSISGIICNQDGSHVVNNVLNIQLIEQLIVANETATTQALFCQHIYQVFQSQLETFSELTLYQRQGDGYVEQVHLPDMENGSETLTSEKNNILWAAIMDNQPHIAESTVYLPLYSNAEPLGILKFIISKPEEQADIHWSIMKSLLSREFHIILTSSHANQSSNLSPELSEDVQIQRALNELTLFASTHQDEKQLLDKGAEILLKILPIDHVGIMMIDEDSEFATLASDSPPRETTMRRIPIEQKLRKRLEQGNNEIIENIKTADFTATSMQSLEAIGVQSTILMPLIDLSGQLIGSVGLDYLESTIALTDEQIQTAQRINTQLVSQLQNLRLLKDSQLFANQMQQIARFGETIQARFELAEILQTTLHFANRILDIDYINIVLYDEGLQNLVIKAYHLNKRDVILPTNTPTIPIENTVIGTVWKNRDPVYVRHMDQSRYENPHAPNIKTLYAVTLISQGVTRGAIEIGRADTQGIRRIDRSVLIQMASQLAVALANATTYIESQQLAQNKILANEIALQLQQQVDLDSLLNTTVTELGKALGAKRARIRLGVQQVVGDN